MNSWVVCYEYAYGPFKSEQAYREARNANDHVRGYDCPSNDHHVVQSETKPLTGYEVSCEEPSDYEDELKAYDLM